MNYYNASRQMDLSDRIAIETGICIGESFKKIAKRLRRHPSTIAHEVNWKLYSYRHRMNGKKICISGMVRIRNWYWKKNY